MRHFRKPRLWIALLVGVTAGVVGWHWPASPRIVLVGDHMCWHIAFSPDCSLIAVLDREPGLHARAQISVWDTATGQLRHRIDLDKRHYVSKIAFAPDGEHLGIVDAGPIVKWSLKSNRQVAEFCNGRWSHDPDHRRELLFARDGRWLLHVMAEGRTYDAETGKVVLDYASQWPERNLGDHGGSIGVFHDGKMKSIDAISGAEIGAFTSPPRGLPTVRGAALSADGVHAIYFDANNRWVASNAITGRECELPFALDMVYGIGFSHNGRLAAVTLAKSPRSAMDRVRLKFQSHRWLHVYDTATGEEVCDPIYRGSQCWFSPDGKLLAVEYNHNQIAVWNWPMAPPRWPLACTLGTASAFGSLAIAALWSRRRKKVNPASAGLTATPSST